LQWLGFACVELSWSPADFWAATPAELAAISAYLRDRASGLDEPAVAALRAQLKEETWNSTN
jgi:hypothetical protein